MRKIFKVISLLIFYQNNEPTFAAEFSTLVRDLNVLQNRMVRGDALARDAAARQFDAIEKVLSTTDSKTWKDEKNVRALIVYLLCGGEASAKERKIDIGVSGKLEMLLNGSLLYAGGKESGAPKELMEIDPRGLPQSLGGHLALIQAGAMAGKDDARAVQSLDLARLLLPGSLVEEAALRREIALLNPIEEMDKFTLLSLRYVSLYLKSPYAENFWDAFQQATLNDASILSKSAKILQIYDSAPPEIRLSANLEVARHALNAGKFDRAQDAIEKAASATVGQGSMRRIAFYRSILSALKEEHPSISFNKSDSRDLTSDESALYEMSSSIVSALASRKSGDEALKDDNYDITATMRRAIIDSDDLLKRSISR